MPGPGWDAPWRTTLNLTPDRCAICWPHWRADYALLPAHADEQPGQVCRTVAANSMRGDVRPDCSKVSMCLRRVMMRKWTWLVAALAVGPRGLLGPPPGA